MSHHFQDLAGLARPARSQGAIISLSGISFSYNGARRAVLRDLTLEIPQGAITAILGPNGSGKTTLLRLVLGVLHPQQGKIIIAGQEQASYSRRELGQLVGLVPQDEHIPFDFSILEYVLLGRAPYLRPLAMPGETDYQAALTALQATGLADMRDRALPNLSGGERQLAVVARALAQQPYVLLMDEPTSHLDLRNKGNLQQIMRTLAGQGYTLIITTHDPNVAAAVASHVVLIHSGQILDSGPSQAILTTEKLSETYGLPVQVFENGGRRLILLP